jgi:hypothetical protein
MEDITIDNIINTITKILLKDRVEIVLQLLPMEENDQDDLEVEVVVVVERIAFVLHNDHHPANKNPIQPQRIRNPLISLRFLKKKPNTKKLLKSN